MTRVMLMEALKSFSESATAELIMPTRVQSASEEQEFRAAKVYLMRLPDSRSATKKAPYILHQLMTGQDRQTEGNRPESSAQVRSIFCVYSSDEQEGGLMLLNLMERLRIALLRQVDLEHRFSLDLSVDLETFIYPDDTAPYFMGEMISAWKLPTVKREVNFLAEGFQSN